MGLADITRKIRDHYALGGVELVSKGVFTKFESAVLPLDTREDPTSITLNGKSYEVAGGLPRYRWKRFERGVIMPEVKRAMDDYLQPSDTFIDVGGAMGDTPLYAHSLVGDTGTIHVFEPDVFLQDTLEGNVERNGIENISIHPTAVGAQAGELDAELVVGGGTEEFKTAMDDLDPIEVVTLDGFVTEKDLTPDLVKIDVDGAEGDVLRGATARILGSCPVILELHTSEMVADRADVIDLILQHANEVVFLGAQGNSTSHLRFGDRVTDPDQLDDVVSNLLLR